MKKVDWTKWSAIAEILGAISIVATLIYLTIQTQQNTDAIEANSRHTIIATDLQLIDNLIENPSLELNLSKDELTDEEKVQLENFLIGVMRTREHQWLQYQRGLLDERTWETYLSALPGTLMYRRSNGWWRQFRYQYFDDEFVDEIDAYLEEFPIIEEYIDPFEVIEAAGP